ncbi:MAG: hypothetical protein OJF61_001767 [Rhodanobacteraceae bacterium]|nr:MAG: hypothetical protein OJF61_001767 [Rhodanobacteraceae bacterium]
MVVIPAKAGIQCLSESKDEDNGFPVPPANSAGGPGMTKRD